MSQRKHSAALLLPTDFHAQLTNRLQAYSRSVADYPARKARKMMRRDGLFPGLAVSFRKERNAVPWEYLSSLGVLNCESQLSVPGTLPNEFVR
jgi:hypothetical protein